MQLGNVRADELGVDDPFDPVDSVRAYKQHAEQSRAILERDGFEADGFNTYLLWQQGLTGGRDILKNTDKPIVGFKRERNMMNNKPPTAEFKKLKNPTVGDWLREWKRHYDKKRQQDFDVTQWTPDESWGVNPRVQKVMDELGTDLSDPEVVNKFTDSLLGIGVIHKVYRAGAQGLKSARGFDSPRELGVHVALEKKLAENVREVKGGTVSEGITKDLKPFRATEEVASTWWPHISVKNILSGTDKLSSAARNDLIQVRDMWFRAKTELDKKIKQLEYKDYVEEVEDLAATYNKKIQGILSKEGYDSIIYSNKGLKETAGVENTDSLILFTREQL